MDSQNCTFSHSSPDPYNSCSLKSLRSPSTKKQQVGSLQAFRHCGELWALQKAHDWYRPVNPQTGQRVSNPFDSFKGNGTGGTTKTRLKMKADPKSTLLQVCYDYYTSLTSYAPPETLTERLLEPLYFLKWYLIVAINMLVAYPIIRTVQNHFPRKGNQLKTWYATTPVCEEIDCAISN